MNIRSSKFSCSISQYRNRKYTFDWSASLLFHTMNFQRSNSIEGYAGESAIRHTGEVTTSKVSTEKIGVPANRPTPTTSASTSICWRRRNRSTHIGPTLKHWWRPSFNPSLPTVSTEEDPPCFQLDALVDHSVRTTSKTACHNWERAALL